MPKGSWLLFTIIRTRRRYHRLKKNDLPVLFHAPESLCMKEGEARVENKAWDASGGNPSLSLPQFFKDCAGSKERRSSLVTQSPRPSSAR
jgi:hypothetical protein